jgi:translation elongation factor EF-4
LNPDGLLQDGLEHFQHPAQRVLAIKGRTPSPPPGPRDIASIAEPVIDAMILTPDRHIGATLAILEFQLKIP